MTEKTAYPLFWPTGRVRSKQRKTNGQFKTSFASARDNCEHEIKLLGGTKTVISTNIRLKRDGRAEHVDFGKTIPDPGVAVYFQRNGKEMCFACDCWNHVQDNMHAIALTISALRGIARWGTGDMMEAAFRGFAALPERTSSAWHEVLGVRINASPEQVKEAYRVLVKKHHPDLGGNAEQMRRVQAAWTDFENAQRNAV